jgi:hypothetical protein
MAAVFLTFHENDIEKSMELLHVLKNCGHEVTRNKVDAQAGEYLDAFFKYNINKNAYIVSLLSKHTFTNMNDNREMLGLMISSFFDDDKKFIPVALDNAYRDSKFYMESMRIIAKKLEEYKEMAKELDMMGASKAPIESEINALNEARNQLGNFIQKLKEIKVATENNHFKDVISAIH